MNNGDHVISILSGDHGVVTDRYGYTFNPAYFQYRVFLSIGVCQIIKGRHLRKALAGETRIALREKLKRQ